MPSINKHRRTEKMSGSRRNVKMSSKASLIDAVGGGTCKIHGFFLGKECGYCRIDKEKTGCPHCGSKTKHKSWCTDQQIINTFRELEEIEKEIIESKRERIKSKGDRIMKNYVRLIDKLSKEQDKLLSIDRKTDSNKKRDKLGERIREISEQINTIYNVANELKEQGINDPIINNEGKCYSCNNAIDIENELCIIFKHPSNDSYILYDKQHYPSYRKDDPVAVIGYNPLTSKSSGVKE